jgi:hypothetical protein
MAIADWIRRHTAKSVEKRVNEARQEGYGLGYADAKEGKPKQPPIKLQTKELIMAPEDSSEST